MHRITMPQGPWANPPLEAGLYNAQLVSVSQGSCDKGRTRYLQLMFWLCDYKRYCCTNLYIRSGKNNNRTIERLDGLCRALECTPKDLITIPLPVADCHLQITIERCSGVEGNGYQPYSDISRFWRQPAFQALQECEPEKESNAPQKELVDLFEEEHL